MAKESKKGVKHVPKESTEQIAFFQWVRLAFPKLIAYHIPNGGKRSLRTAVRLKREGVTAGVPDVFVSKRSGPYAGMYIEMKRQDGGALSEQQRDMISELRSEGYFVQVCKGFGEARDALLYYLSLGEPQIG